MPLSVSPSVTVKENENDPRIQNSAARPTQARHSGTPIPALQPCPVHCQDHSFCLSLCSRAFSLLICVPSHLATTAHACCACSCST